MHFSNILLGAGLAQLGLAAYTLKDDYSGNNFANMFNFNTFDDPTQGYVNFVDQNTAQSSGLFTVNNGKVRMGVDHTNVASGRGRNSVRVTSKIGYTHGLVVLDLAHMPGSICGAWPAFWMTGPNWPNSGEIDIIEGVNLGTNNRMTMHTSGGCTLAGSNCQGNEGCGITGGGYRSYGNGFNDVQGGIYAMEWKSSQISVWFFPHSKAPSDIHSANPNPSNWGNPTGTFASSSGCDIDSHFNNNNIVLDTTFCGDWAGAVWSQDKTCSRYASTCEDYVKNHPNDFKYAYWEINSLKVYSANGAVSKVRSVSASGNASSVALPTASHVSSGAPMPSANSSHPFNATDLQSSQILVSESSSTHRASSNPTVLSPAETAGAVQTKTSAGSDETAQLPTLGASHYHGHPPNHGPKGKRVSRVARHLQQHAHGAHGAHGHS